MISRSASQETRCRHLRRWMLSVAELARHHRPDLRFPCKPRMRLAGPQWKRCPFPTKSDCDPLKLSPATVSHETVEFIRSSAHSGRRDILEMSCHARGDNSEHNRVRPT